MKAIINLLKDNFYSRLEEKNTDDMQPITISRWNYKHFLLLAVFIVVIYAFIKSLNINTMMKAIDTANPYYLMISFLCVLLISVGSAIAFKCFSTIKIPFFEVYINQLSTFFLAIVAPGGVGFAIAQVKLLIKHKQERTLAVATSIFIQVCMVLSTVILLIVCSIGAGGGDSISSSIRTILIILCVVFLGFVFWKIPSTNKLIKKYIMPTVEKTKPIFNNISQNPLKLAIGVFGNFIQTLSYIWAFIFIIWSFGYSLPVLKINVFSVAVVYIVGNLSGSFIPTPGGVGAVELALIFGLTNLGIQTSDATLIVLLFRLLSYWIMIPIGAIAYKLINNQNLFRGASPIIVQRKVSKK